MKRKIRHLNERANGTYRYVRDYPTSLRRTFPELPSQFSEELRLNNSCSDTELLAAMKRASANYDLHVKMLQNSDPAAYSESEIRRATEIVLRQKGLHEGQLAHVPKSQYTKEEWERAMQSGAEIVPDRYDLAEWAVPEIDDIGDALNRGEKLTIIQEAHLNAWKVIQNLPKTKLRYTMREAWDMYCKDKRLDLTQGDGKAKQQRFDRVFKHTGDFIITKKTRDDVQDRIQSFITMKQQENPKIKAQSIERELSEFIAALRHLPKMNWGDRLTLFSNKGSTDYRIPKRTKPVSGRVLSDDELRLLFKTCLDKADEKWTALLVMVHAGLGIREVRRLRLDKDVFLDAKYPHIIFRGGDEGITKTEARPRVVPIVLGLEVIKEFLPETIAWMNRLDQDSSGVTLNKRLRRLLGQDVRVKSHMFRHTWLRLARRARLTEDNKHAIAGWQKGDSNSEVMERVYDDHGFLDDPELLAQLYDDQRNIFSRFLADLTAVDNVIQLRK